MKAKNPKEIFNPFVKFSVEDEIFLEYEENFVLLKVRYISREDKNKKYSITYKFLNTCYHLISSFPGVNMSICEKEIDNKRISSLVEYQFSELKISWENHFNKLYDLKHFEIYFLNENIFFEAICTDVELIEIELFNR